MTGGDASSLRLQEGGLGTVVRLHCRPGRSTTRITGIHDGALKVDVGAPPEKGKANRELVAWFSKALKVGKAGLEITSGEGARDKSLLVAGMRPEELRGRLAALLSFLVALLLS